MRRLFKQRVCVACAATVVAAVCGAASGYLLGRAVALRRAEGRLGQFAARIVAEGDAASTEARRVLGTMRAASLPVCSEAEITYFRGLVFQSEFLKDAGRIRGGKIVCAATLGALQAPFQLPNADISQPDGSRVYWNLAPFERGRQAAVTLQQGEAFVTFSAHNQRPQEPLIDHYTITTIVVDGAGQRYAWSAGAWTQNVDPIRMRNGRGKQAESLYATSCSGRYFNCVTAYSAITSAVRADRIEVLATIVLGGGTGACLGFLVSLLYRRNRSMAQQLRRAIRQDRLRVVYQPIVSLANGRIVGAEALTRWSDEDGIAVAPDIFVKVAEENGFVGEITALVARRALHDFAQTLRSHSDFHLSINVAAADLTDPRFLPMLKRSLKQAGVEAESLAIEITESSTVRHKAAMETILHLRQQGHSVHIDDFGTGYSNLSYLHDLSVTAIKIDKSFTRSIGTEAVTLSILPQILSMAEALNLQVIVEGIETSRQAVYFAARTQPIYGQGWFFGRPVDSAEFLRLLADDIQEVRAQADAA